MNQKFKIKKIIFLLITLNYLLSSCNSHIEESIDKTSKLLSNGKLLVIEKNNIETTSIGYFTGHNYGTSHLFTYKLSINPGDINWDGGSAEPKHIIFYKDTSYIRYLKKKSIEVEYIDSIDNTIKYNHHYETQEFFQKHIDKRYFFKLLGNDYWIEISPEDYSSVKKFDNEYIIPNDNELSIKR